MKRAMVLVIAACSRRDLIASCDDDLRGVYVAGDERWMMLDNGDGLEAYPLFPDSPAPAPQDLQRLQGLQGSMPMDTAAGIGSTVPGAPVLRGSSDLVVAPRVIEFQRTPAAVPSGSTNPGPPRGGDRSVTAGRAPLAGTLRRRYMRRAERCEAHVPVHLTRCAGDTLELVIADPSPPIEFSPCTWPRPGPSRLVRWRRE